MVVVSWLSVAGVCMYFELSFCPESRAGDMQLILSFWRRDCLRLEMIDDDDDDDILALGCYDLD